MVTGIANIEFYNTPEGDVMLKEVGCPARVLQESDRELISEMLAAIRDRYPAAHARLMELYSASTMNRWHYEFRVVHRFIRCNFGEYDQHTLDIDRNGVFRFEEVSCPLRGECVDEGVICRPRMDTRLTEREREVFRLIGECRMQTDEVARELHISPCTVARHRENIKAKLGARSVAELVDHWHRSAPE